MFNKNKKVLSLALGLVMAYGVGTMSVYASPAENLPEQPPIVQDGQLNVEKDLKKHPIAEKDLKRPPVDQNDKNHKKPMKHPKCDDNQKPYDSENCTMPDCTDKVDCTMPDCNDNETCHLKD